MVPFDDLADREAALNVGKPMQIDPEGFGFQPPDLLIGIIFLLDAWCSDSSSYSLDSAPNTLDEYCDQYPQLCETATP